MRTKICLKFNMEKMKWLLTAQQMHRTMRAVSKHTCSKKKKPVYIFSVHPFISRCQITVFFFFCIILLWNNDYNIILRFDRNILPIIHSSPKQKRTWLQICSVPVSTFRILLTGFLNSGFIHVDPGLKKRLWFFAQLLRF